MSTTKGNQFVQPYLFFHGNCEEAVEFYRKALGAEVEMTMRYNESPEPPPPGMVPPGFEDKIMHTSFRIGETTVMASDDCASEKGRLPRLFSLPHSSQRSRCRSRLRRSSRRRPGADAAGQDLLVSLLRHVE